MVSLDFICCRETTQNTNKFKLEGPRGRTPYSIKGMLTTSSFDRSLSPLEQVDCISAW